MSDPSSSDHNSLDFDATQKVPHEIGGCTVTSPLGKGGMGSVFKGYHQTLHTTVAIKLLSPKLTNDHESIERFFREARSIAKLDHENLVRVLNVGEEKGQYFIVMQFVDGETLRQIAKRKGPIPVSFAVNYMYQSCRGLQEAHKKNIIHRDIKPDNLMVNREGRLKITDFGLARDVDTSASLTQQGEILGSPYYMSPEQCKGKKEHIDHRTDIYSLGATFYHLLTGKPPFDGETPILIMMKHVKEKPKPMSNFAPHVPLPLIQIIDAMLAKNQDERPNSCEELEHELKKHFGMDALDMKPLSQIETVKISNTRRPTSKLTLNNYVSKEAPKTAQKPLQPSSSLTPPSPPLMNPPSSPRPPLTNYAIEETVNVNFKEQAKVSPQNYAIEDTINIKHNQHGKSKRYKPRSKFPLFLLLLLLILGGAGAGYYQLYNQAQLNAKSYLSTLQKDSPKLPKDYLNQMKKDFKEKKYQQAMKEFHKLVGLSADYDEILQKVETFKKENNLFLTESIFSAFLNDIEKQKLNVADYVKKYDESLTQERLKAINFLVEILKRGRWKEFIQEMERAKTLFSSLIRYNLEPKPECFGFTIPEAEVPRVLRDQISKLFFEIETTHKNHQEAKELLEKAQKFWEEALNQKNFDLLQQCFETYQELYHKIPETDYHRLAQVPLLITPTLNQEQELEFTKKQDWGEQLKVEVKNAQFQQVLVLEGVPKLLFFHKLPVRLSRDKPQISLKIHFPGFESIQEYLSTDQLEHLNYKFPLKRNFVSWPHKDTFFLIPHEEKLILVTEEEKKCHISAIDADGIRLWKISVADKLTFPPTLYKNYLFFGITAEDGVEAKSFLYKIEANTPKLIGSAKIQGGIRSQGCFLPQYQMICFAGTQKLKKSNKVRACLRFHALGNLAQKEKPESFSKAISGSITYNPSESVLFFETKNYLYSFSLKEKKILWKAKITEKDAVFDFQPICGKTSVSILKNTKKSGYLVSYNLKKNEVIKELDLGSSIPYPPQTNSNVIAVTSHKELFAFKEDSLENFASYRSPTIIATSAIFDGHYFYFFKENGNLVSLNAKGELAWEYLLLPKIPPGAKLTGNPVLFGEYLVLPFSHALIAFKRTKS